MTNSADPDQLASSEANWSGSTLFAKTGHVVFSKRRVKISCVFIMCVVLVVLHVTAMISQSASKRLRWYISQHLESLKRSLPSQWKVNSCKWLTSSSTLEAHCLELCTLMMKSKPGMPKLVQHLADYVEVFGISVESDLTQSWKSTDLWCCQHYYMHVKLGQFTKCMPKDWATSRRAVLENF